MRKKVKIHIRGFSERVREELENAEIEILIRKRGKPRNSDWDEGKIILVAKKKEDNAKSKTRGSGAGTTAHYSHISIEKLLNSKHNRHRIKDAKRVYMRWKGRRKGMRRQPLIHKQDSTESFQR